MKTILLLLSAGLVLGCQSDKVIYTPSCDFSQNYAKTPTEANQRLTGTWKLRDIGGYVASPPPVPDQSIVFSRDGTCVITEDGQRSGPLVYQIGTIQNFYGSSATYPSLQVNDMVQDASKRLRIGGPVVLLICDDQLKLDYGSPVDLPAYTYQKVK